MEPSGSAHTTSAGIVSITVRRSSDLLDRWAPCISADIGDMIPSLLPEDFTASPSGSYEWDVVAARVTGVLVILVGLLLAARACVASPAGDHPISSIFDPRSTPADTINQHSHFVLDITGMIFLVVFTLLTYAIVKFRQTTANADREPAQVYGSTPIELASTIIPILIG